MKNAFFILLILLFNLHSQASMKVSQGRLDIIESFPSKHIEPRTVRVWLPNNYNTKIQYAILFMHDGQMLFDSRTTWNGQEWGVDETAQRLIDYSEVMPFIVVGIDNIPTKRHAEYFPQKPFEALPKSKQQSAYELQRSPDQLLFGGNKVQSDLYLKFIIEELKPYIKRHYSVFDDSKHHFIMGSSMGGLISWYAISEYPNEFGGAACISTHWLGGFDPNDRGMFNEFYEYLENTLPQPQTFKLYFDLGDKTLDQYYPPYQEEINEMLISLNYKSPLTKTLFFPGADHSEKSWSARLEIPLTFLLRN